MQNITISLEEYKALRDKIEELQDLLQDFRLYENIYLQLLNKQQPVEEKEKIGFNNEDKVKTK